VPEEVNAWKRRVQVDSRWHAELVEVQTTSDDIQRFGDRRAGEAAPSARLQQRLSDADT
jgi:hypothetical protein